MKKLLPKSISNPSGFTLIELLVVMTILAIMAVIGFVGYSGIAARGRDTRRIAEIDSIQKAFEKNYRIGVGYILLANADFVANTVPLDPLNAQAKCGTNNDKICAYCSRPVTDTPSENGVTCTNTVSLTQPPAGPSYFICTNLETAAGAGGVKYY